MAYSVAEMIEMTKASNEVSKADPTYDGAEFWQDLSFELSDDEMKAKYPLYNPEDWEWFYKFEEKDYEHLEAWEQLFKTLDEGKRLLGK
ncbi:hypothetical protein [Nostoc sp. ChiVER01]|uniref:hypothetical protein n=1 Tax=Nostoc sp. ChiVER01 TaxID=3075382 RepID=UPI002AD51C3B|nr:hypothetical protein [Nostoc sp. ChiVER01]MDZ8221853.1 hypothetical protein [Nostoc sp. ChiVER01]